MGLISNPLMEVEDLPTIAQVAHAHGCKLIVDNTFATPAVAQPLKLGAEKLFIEGRCGGMLSADIAGGERGACTFIRECESVKFVPSLAGVTTTISYPARTSHRAYSPEEMEKVGISMGQLRFSIGLEDIDDIIGEFERALAKV